MISNDVLYKLKHGLLLEHQDNEEYYKRIDIDLQSLNTTYSYVIIGQDFYVALRADGYIHSNIAVNKESALKEYNDAIKMVEEYKNKLSGGLGNGLS